jgi:hypothetical protein
LKFVRICILLLDEIHVGLRLNAIQKQKIGMAVAVIAIAVMAPTGFEMMGRQTRKTDTTMKAIG